MSPEKFKAITHRYLTDPVFHAVVHSLGMSELSFSEVLDAAALAMHIRLEREIRGLAKDRTSNLIETHEQKMAMQYLTRGQEEE